MSTSHRDTAPGGQPRALDGDGWRRIQQELAILMAPTGHRMPPVERDERVLWVQPNHRRGVLRVHPRTTGLARPELHYLLAEALVLLAVGPPPVWVRWHPGAGLATAAVTALAGVAAAAGLLPMELATGLGLATVALLTAGQVSIAARNARVAGLLQDRYRPSVDESESPRPPSLS